MKHDFPFVRRNYDTIVAGTHLFVFLFVMTAVAYETQHQRNPAIGNYVDALYFTVTTLTTTGFGDITLPGTAGRLLSIVMMIDGVSLFVRMVQVLFRPRRVHHKCTSCGLSEHETDAVHCKRWWDAAPSNNMTAFPHLTQFSFLLRRVPVSGHDGHCRGHKASGRSGSCIAPALMTISVEAPGTDSPSRSGYARRARPHP